MPTSYFSDCEDDLEKRISFFRYMENSIPPDKFLEIFKEADFAEDFYKTGIINQYMEKANSITPDQFLEIFKAANFSDDFDKRISICRYMEKANSIPPDQFLAIFKSANFTYDVDKRIFIDLYIEKENSITHEQFLEIFKEADFADDFEKVRVINNYIDKNPNNINPEEFLKILQLAGFTYDLGKKEVINNYIDKNPNNINPEEFLKILQLADFTEDFGKATVINKYIDKNRNHITPKQFLEIFKAAVFIDEGQKIDMIKNYLSNENNQDFDKLLHIFSSDQSGDLKYSVGFICNTLKNIYPNSTKQTAKNLSELGNKLYPNAEQLRIGLFEEAIDKKLINKDNIQCLRLDNIESSDLLLDFLAYAQSKIHTISELDILKLTKGRYHSRYESLSNLLKDASPENVFSEEGMERIQGIFSSNINEFKALDILSYFDVKGRVENFYPMLKKDFKQNIKNEFKPSKDQLLISEEELDKIAKLTGDKSVKGKFSKVGGLCCYIKDKVGQSSGQLPVLNEGSTINFQSSTMIDPEIHEKLNNRFKKAFEQNASNDDILAFFSLVIDPAQQDTDSTVITDANKEKLLEFFNKSKKDISQLLQKEGGLDKFITTLSAINDGCSANIGNQFHIALYNCLLQDNSDAILYQILSQDIIPAILNKGGDVISIQPDPLSNTRVRNYHYSPEALFDKVAEVFYDPKKEKAIGRSATDLIRDKYDNDKAHEIIELLENNKATSDEGAAERTFNQNAAQIAAYLTLSHSGLIPEKRLQSILVSNISLNDENKRKLTNILGVSDSVFNEIRIEVPSPEVSGNMPGVPNPAVSGNMPGVPNPVVRRTLIQRLMSCFAPNNR